MSIKEVSTMKPLSLAAALLLCASFAHADSLPAWNLSASGFFGGYGQPAETFQANLALHYQQDPDSALVPLWTGTVTFAGLLGDFTANYVNAIPNAADGGYLAVLDNYGDEIDFDLLPYAFGGPDPFSPFTPPSMLSPFLYTCNVVEICAEYGASVGLGVFAGWGNTTQTASRVDTPEPATLLLLAVSLPFILCTLNKRRAAV